MVDGAAMVHKVNEFESCMALAQPLYHPSTKFQIYLLLRQDPNKESFQREYMIQVVPEPPPVSACCSYEFLLQHCFLLSTAPNVGFDVFGATKEIFICL